MPTARMRRVNEAVKEVISTRVAEGLKDPRVGFVTVTSVDTSADLRQARVYVSILGDDESRRQALDGLGSSSGYLQSELAAQLTLKRTPTLEFLYDESIDRGMRITELLQAEAPEERS